METYFVHVFNVILPVLICAAIGYWLAIRKMPFDHKVIGEIVKNVGYPTLIISHLSATKVEVASFPPGRSDEEIVAFNAWPSKTVSRSAWSFWEACCKAS